MKLSLKPAKLRLWVRCHASLMVRNGSFPVRGNSCLALWYLLRAADRKGQGWSDISERGLAILLGVSFETVKRWRRSAIALGIIRGADGGRGKWRLWYCSTVNLARLCGVSKLGAIWEEDALRLGSSSMAALATEATIDRRQKHAEYVAKVKGADPKQLLTSKRALNYRRRKRSDSSLSSAERQARMGPISGKGNQTVFAGPAAEFCSLTQNHFADQLEISDRTIRRHTSNDWRLKPRKRGKSAKPAKSKLTRYSKVRVLDKWEDPRLAHRVQSLGGKAIILVGRHEDGSANYGHFITHGHDLYRVRPNLYQITNDHLFSAKRLRRKVARAAAIPLPVESL